MSQAKSAVSTMGSLAMGQSAFVGVDGDSDAQIDAARAAALQHSAAEDLQHMDAQSIVAVQNLLQHGDTLGLWATPQHWLVVSFKRRAVDGTAVDLRERIIDHLPQELQREVQTSAPQTPAGRALFNDLELAVLVMTRYLLLLRMGPVGMKRAKFQPLDVSTVFRLAYAQLPPLFARALAKRSKLAIAGAVTGLPGAGNDHFTELHLLSPLEHEDLTGLSEAARKSAIGECKRMHMLQEMGLWGDVPSLQGPSKAKAMTGQRQFNEAAGEVDSHQPLPDEYVALMGRRSLWLMQDLAPNLFDIGRAMVQLWVDSACSGHAPDTVQNDRYRNVPSILAGHIWKDHEGRAFEAPPFELNLPKETATQRAARSKSSGPAAEEVVWPPRGTRDIVALFGVVQMAHFFILALSMGARQSETLDLRRDAMTRDVDGRPVIRGKDGGFIRGRTFKLEQSKTGRVRDWLLPDIAVRAFEQQVRLVQLVEQIGPLRPRNSTDATPARTSTHLWTQASAGGKSNTSKPLLDINKALATYARALGLDAAPGGQNLRSHRFRKTLARLVALALTQAPKLLMDVFGHKSIEMTLYYILTDKDLRTEIETVERELRVMRAKEVVQCMVDADTAQTVAQPDRLAGYGGLAAHKIQEAVQTYRHGVLRRGEEFGADNVVELAELLTFQGKAWEQVRHGVVCTKVPGQAGPCNKGVGRPEPSKCQSSCNHRLEEAFLREDVDGAIKDALNAFEDDQSKGEELSAAFWAGQIRAHVPRFADLSDKWMRHPTVRYLFNEIPQEVGV